MSASFEQLLEENLSTLIMKQGSLVTGIVIDILENHLVVHVGLKSEAAIQKSEFLNQSGELDLEIGDEVQLTLEAIEDGHGNTRLSREKAIKQEVWKRIEDCLEDDAILKGLITGSVKGGMTVDVQGIKAFLPGSLAEVSPTKDLEHLVGGYEEFKVIKLDKAKDNVVLSRKAVLQEVNSEEREKLLSGLAEGQVIKGIVKNLTDYGAFVDLGGIDGLLHITDISWSRINHPSEALGIGESLDVKVIKYDQEAKKVSLGIKQLIDDPWIGIEEKLPLNTSVMASVTNLTDYGFFAEIETGVEGLVHVSEIDWTNKNIHPSKAVQLGDEVEIMILEIDESRRRLSLGMKQCKPNPWEDFASDHKKDEKITGNIKSITDFGIFIGLDDGIDGLVHLSDLSWTESGDLAVRNYKKGDELKTILISADTDRERISLGVKQLTVNKFQEYTQSNSKGAVVKGKILEKTPKYISIELGDSVVGNLKLSELASDKSVDSMQLDEELELMITNVDKKNQTINLSMKAFEKQNEDKALNDYKENNESVGSSFGDILKEHIDK